MAVINTSAFGKALWPGINAWYGKAYNEFNVEYTDLFDAQKTTSTTKKTLASYQGYSQQLICISMVPTHKIHKNTLAVSRYYKILRPVIAHRLTISDKLTQMYV